MNTIVSSQHSNIPSGFNLEQLIKEDWLTAYLLERPAWKLLHQSTVKWIAFYIVKKCFLKPKRISEQLEYLEVFMRRLAQLIWTSRIYWGNTMRYMSDKTDMMEILNEYLQNAQYWIWIFGIDFFKEWAKKERLYVLRAPIDWDFDIVCKWWSGIWTFCIDVSISFWEQRYPWVVRNELWKMSIDSDSQWIRIVRSGWSMNSKHINAWERMDRFDEFKNKYKILPQRLLWALAMYIAESENKYPLRAISLDWARKKNMSLVASSHVNFDYTKLFSWLGFILENENWLSLNDFLDGIKSLWPHEAIILDKAFHAFNNMKPTYDEWIWGLQLDVSHKTEELIDAFYTKHRWPDFRKPYWSESQKV